MLAAVWWAVAVAAAPAAADPAPAPAPDPCRWRSRMEWRMSSLSRSVNNISSEQIKKQLS